MNEEPIKQVPVLGKKKPPLTKRQKIIWTVSIIAGVLILSAVGYVVYKWYFAKDKTTNTSTVTKKSDKIANPLDGTLSDPNTANRHPLAIIVENQIDSRPQVGLDQASVIYEAIAEGGITRFLAVYGPNDAQKVGPVRSVRTYFLDWAEELNAFLAHVGGNYDALQRIQNEKVYNLDQFAVSDAAYWREPKKGIATEHTMFTSTEKLYQVAFGKDWPKTADFQAWKFKKNADTTATGTGTTNTTAGESVQKATIDFSSPTYKVAWTYDLTTKKYLRELAGEAHKDGQTGVQLSAKTVIIQQVERQETTTAINENGWTMTTVGGGPTTIISEGVKTTGTWKKASTTGRTVFYDSAGQEIQFNPGNLWVEIVPPDIYGKISFQAQ